MEEEIKILEERVNFCKNNKECREELKQCFGCTFEIEEIQAIENLINKVKSQEKQIKLMQSINIAENFIEKSKVREKIEELDKKKRKSQIEYSTIDELIFDKKIEILQELLEERN